MGNIPNIIADKGTRELPYNTVRAVGWNMATACKRPQTYDN